MKVDFKISKGARWVSAAAFAAVGLRALFIAPVLDSTDAVNFALALRHFDLRLHQPHFPGYPLYVLAAQPFAWIASLPVALALPGVLSSALLVGAVYRAVRGRAGEAAGILSAWLVAVAPPLVEVGAAPGSDGLALALFASAFALLFVATERGMVLRPLAIAGGLAGLGLGVRPSAAPLLPSFFLLIALLAPGRRPLTTVLCGWALGTAIWLVPLVGLVGGRTLIDLGLVHIAGHFSTWGGAMGASPSVSGLGHRAVELLRHSATGLGPAIGLAAMLLLLYPRPRPRRTALLWAAVALPYAIWVWLAQNVERTRHAAPLTAILCVAVALAVTHSARGRSWASCGAVASAAILLLLQPRPAPWRRDAALWIQQHLGLERVVLLGSHLPRVAHFYAPALRTGQAVDGGDVARVASALGNGVTVLASSEIPALQRSDLQLQPLVQWGGRTLYAAHFVGKR